MVLHLTFKRGSDISEKWRLTVGRRAYRARRIPLFLHQGDVNRLLRGHYSSVIAPTDSCVPPRWLSSWLLGTVRRSSRILAPGESAMHASPLTGGAKQRYSHHH
jgi:hypothetical protein